MSAETTDTQLRTQKFAELRNVIEAWPKLSDELRAAVLGLTRTVVKRYGFPMKRSTPMPSRPAVSDLIQRRD